ncbi:MAG: hypothetical protein SPI30_02180 [Prevotella sp.]|nr:hypothetical protein [Prevotella sp.]
MRKITGKLFVVAPCLFMAVQPKERNKKMVLSSCSAQTPKNIHFIDKTF